MKFISWNVNGLRAIVGKGFNDIFANFDADFFCLQEIKLQEGQLDINFEGYKAYYNYAERKGYSGTAIFEYPDFYLVNVYTPNSQSELARLDYRMEWEEEFLKYIKSLDAVKPVIICGDMNVAHREIDLANPKSNRRNPGFTDEERGAMSRMLESGFVDTFRHLNPELAGAYSGWSYRGRAREKNVGWRIDYFLVSARLADSINNAEIHPDICGSDHCPVSLDLN